MSEVTIKREKGTTPQARCGSPGGTPQILYTTIQYKHDLILASEGGGLKK